MATNEHGVSNEVVKQIVKDVVKESSPYIIEAAWSGFKIKLQQFISDNKNYSGLIEDTQEFIDDFEKFTIREGKLPTQKKLDTTDHA